MKIRTNWGGTVNKSLIAVAAMLGSFGANAATVSYSFGIPLALTPVDISPTGSLALFDSNLGILTGVDLRLSSGASLSFSATNVSAETRQANVTQSIDIFWNSGNVTVDSEIFAATTSFFASSGPVDFAAGQTLNFGPFSASDSDLYNPQSFVASLQAAGGGNFTLTCSSLTGMRVTGGGGNVVPTQSATAGCGAEVVYTYSENQVPEPGTLLLAGLALAGLGAVRRYKKA